METIKEAFCLQPNIEQTGQFNVAEYIKSIQLKGTLVGGFNKESVYIEMKKLSVLFQEQVVLLETQLKQAASQSEKLQIELEAAKKESAGLNAILEEEQQNKAAYHNQISVLEYAVKAVQQTEQDARNAAQSQAASIIEAAKSEATQFLQESRSTIIKTNSDRDAVKKAKSEISALLEKLHSDVIKTISEVEKQKKMFASITTESISTLSQMDDEFYIDFGQYDNG